MRGKKRERRAGDKSKERREGREGGDDKRKIVGRERKSNT